MKEGRLWRRAAAFAVIGAALLVWYVRGQAEAPRVLDYAEFWRMAEDGEIEAVSLGEGENWRVKTTEGETALTPNPRAEDGKERLLRLGIRVTEDNAIFAALAYLTPATGSDLSETHRIPLEEHGFNADALAVSSESEKNALERLLKAASGTGREVMVPDGKNGLKGLVSGGTY